MSPSGLKREIHACKVPDQRCDCATRQGLADILAAASPESPGAWLDEVERLVKRVRRDADVQHGPAAQVAQSSPATAAQLNPRPQSDQQQSALPAAPELASTPATTAERPQNATCALLAPPVSVTDTTEQRGSPSALAKIQPASASTANGKVAKGAAAKMKVSNQSLPGRRVTRSQPTAQVQDSTARAAQDAAVGAVRDYWAAVAADRGAGSAAKVSSGLEQPAEKDAGKRSAAKKSPAQRHAAQKRPPAVLRVSRSSAGPAAAAKMHRAMAPELGWKRKAAALSDGSAAAGVSLRSEQKRRKQQKEVAAAHAKTFVRAPRFDGVSLRAGSRQADVKLAPWQTFQTPLRFRSRASLSEGGCDAGQEPGMKMGQSACLMIPRDNDDVPALAALQTPHPTDSTEQAAGSPAHAAVEPSAEVKPGNPSAPSAAPDAAPAAASTPQVHASVCAAKPSTAKAPAVSMPALRSAQRSAAPSASAGSSVTRSTGLPATNGEPQQPPSAAEAGMTAVQQRAEAVFRWILKRRRGGEVSSSLHDVKCATEAQLHIWFCPCCCSCVLA